MENIEKNFINPKNNQEQTKESLERESISQVKEVIRKEGPHLATFAGDASLKYTPSLEAKTFAFDHESNEVIVPVQWFLDRGYSPDGLRFAFYHELSHFIDMRNDPSSYLENFEYKKSGKANKDICSWLENKLEADEVEQEKIENLKKPKKRDDKGTQMDDLQVMAYQYLHTMYNILDDISVNNLVMQKAPVYSGEEGRKEMENIYQKLGFEENDFREKPKHVQFIYSLLRDEMLPDSGESVLDDEVSEIINKKKRYGKTVKQIIEKLKPKSGEMPEAGERYEYIRKYLEPIYLKLLKEDIQDLDFKQMEEEAEKQKQQSEQGQEAQDGEESEDKEQQEGSDSGGKEEKQGSESQEEGEQQKRDEKGEGQEEEGEEGEEKGEFGGQGQETGGKEQEGEGSEDQVKEGEEQDGQEGKEQESEGSHEAGGDFDFNPFKEHHENPKDPDEMMTEEEIEKMLERFLQDKKYADMTPEERAEANQERLKAEFDKKYEISKETRELFEKRKNEIKEPRKEMRKFWKRLIGESVQLTRKKVRKQRRGNVNVEDYVESYPDIVEGTRSGKLDKLNIYEGQASEMENVNQPERIEVSLVCDMSGSMNQSKIEALQKTVSLLLLSLKDFNSYLDQSRRETKTKLSAYSEVYVFSDSFERVKQFRDEYQANKQERNDAEIIKTFNYLENSTGTTNDAAVLSEIVRSVDSRKEKSIKKGKERKIVFEITDGQPNSDIVEDTKSRVGDMLDKKIIPIAFQIGRVSDQERKTFEHVWNEDRDTQLGYSIGEEIDQLPEELMRSLKQKFGNIKL